VLSNNQLSSINLNKNEKLVSIKIDYNNINLIDFSKNKELHRVYINENKFIKK
jgi:hypothetical protein